MLQRIQHIVTTLSGIVKKSNQSIFKVQIDELLQNFHPFFYSIDTIPNSEKPTVFHCVNLSLSDELLIVDIEFLRRGTNLSIIIQDLTNHYNNYQSVAQEKNELILDLEKTDTRNSVLENREQFKNIFIQNFSHELRNPLMHLISFTSLLANTKLSQEQKDYVGYLEQSGKRLSSVLEDILDLGKINTGRVFIKKQPFNFLNLLKSICLLYELKAKKKGVKFNMIIHDEIPEILISDEHLLFQVLTNLLNNAIELTSSGEVVFKVILNNKWGKKINLDFQIIDSGEKIPKDELSLLFDSLYNLKELNSSFDFGLGLTITKRLLRLLKSEIKVTHAENGGNVFYFELTFNLLQKSYAEFSNPKEKPSATKALTTSTSKKKVIIVEDDEKIQMVLFKYLLEEKKFIIDAFLSSDNIIKILTDTTYDILILNLDIENLGIDSFIKTIREIPFKKVNSIPILGITNNNSLKHLVNSKPNGLNKVLIKPFSKTDLLDGIKAVS